MTGQTACRLLLADCSIGAAACRNRAGASSRSVRAPVRILVAGLALTGCGSGAMKAAGTVAGSAGIGGGAGSPAGAAGGAGSGSSNQGMAGAAGGAIDVTSDGAAGSDDRGGDANPGGGDAFDSSQAGGRGDAGGGAVDGGDAGGGAPAGMTYADYAKLALTSMIKTYYTNGKWRALPGGGGGNHDWGNDSMTGALYFDWLVNREASAPAMLDALAGTMNTAPAPCAATANCIPWSDEYLWDAVAGARENEVTGSATGLSKSKTAFDYVDKAAGGVWTAGACPEIRYQRPDHGSGGLKTNETDSNYIKAAILLYERTNDMAYLSKAESAYAANRKYYLDAGGSNLYSVYLYDVGGTCTQQQGRYFGSVQGNMIFSGLALYEATSTVGYLNDALATAHAVDTALSDPGGIYADLQAENDVVQPLVEAMYAVWKDQGQTFARDWIMRNAAASVSTITATGAYGRFFNGPISTGIITQWQTNGGYALAFAAAAIDPAGVPAAGRWNGATMTAMDIGTAALPTAIHFTGSGIALIGTIGEQCCEAGHARVFVDGVETRDTTGIWQNKSSASQSLPDSVLFAWTWQSPGMHTVQIQPGLTTGKEGGSFVHIQSYLVRQ